MTTTELRASMSRRSSTADRARRALRDPDVRFVVGAFLLGRVLVSGLALLGWQLPARPPDKASAWVAQPPSHAWHALFTGLERYDAQWYLQIARDGYVPGDPSSAYFPLYPLLVRVVGVPLGGHWLLAATLVSNVALLLALLALFRLTRRELSARAGRWTVVLLLLNPVGFFLYAPYTESLFLLLAVLCLTWLREGRWWAAGAAAALGSATRSTGIALVAVLAVEALRQAGWWPRDRRALRQLVDRWCASALGAAGLVAFLGYWQARTTWREPTNALRTGFGRVPTAPWTTVWRGIDETAHRFSDASTLPYTIESLLGLAALALGVVAVRRYPPPYGVFVVASLLMPLLMAIPGRSMTSVARYDLVVFPVVWALAEVTSRRAVRAAVVSVSGSLLCILTLLFVSWHPVL